LARLVNTTVFTEKLKESKKLEERNDSLYEEIYALVEKIKEGDREAFMTLTSLYQKKVFLLAYSFFRNREDALDIVQETFLKLYQKISLFRRGENFQNWLLQISKNLCIDRYRKDFGKNKDLQSGIPVEEMNISSHNSPDPYLSSDLKRIFSTCIKKLAERQRMIFVMKHYNQLKYTLHFKAVQNLRGLVAPYLGGQL